MRRRRKSRAWVMVVVLSLVAGLATTFWLHSPMASPFRYQLGPLSWLGGLSEHAASVENDDLLLYLRPGGCTMSGCLVTPATDIPQGDVQLRLPLYPGAKSTSQLMSTGLSYSMTPYLKAASAKFVLPTDAATAQTWFSHHLAQRGYYAGCCSQTSGDSSSGVSTSGQTYMRRDDPHLQIEIDFEPSGGKTVLFYGAATIALPPRPSNSLLPSDVSQMEMMLMYSGLPLPSEKLQPWRHIVKDATTLQRIVSLINSLPLSSKVVGGTLADPDRATLVFREPNGRSRELSVQVCCGDIALTDSPPLDGKDKLWSAIVSLAAVSGVHVQ